MGNEKNVYNNTSPFFQANVPSLVFYLPGLLALSLPLLLALSSAEVLCPGNRTVTRTLIGTLCLRKDSGICVSPLASVPSVVALELGCVTPSWLVGVWTGPGSPL